MLNHINTEPVNPERVVIMGAAGFVGSALKRKLDNAGINNLPISRSDINLLEADAHEKLLELLLPGDAFVAVSAIAPVKTVEMLKDNLTMLESMTKAISHADLSQVVNVSSDAIYADSEKPLTEESSTSPGSLHGIMHLTREVILQESAGDTPYATLRPTLIYGIDDPHNGYGPNRFRRLAKAGKEITLFGNGEERRDHIWVEDVAELLKLMLMYRSKGKLNAATGMVISFREIAELIVSLSMQQVPIVSMPRSGPMPHNGYRPFNPSMTKRAFPNFEYTNIEDGLRRIII